MSARRVLAALALAAWIGGGCASILDVDSDDYADASTLVCLCANDNKSCAAEVEEAINKDAELEKLAIECLAEVEDPECGAGTIASCVFEKGYCVAKSGQRCLVGKDGEPILGCCDGLACQALKCCVVDGSPCTGSGECCSGLECEGNTCVFKCSELLVSCTFTTRDDGACMAHALTSWCSYTGNVRHNWLSHVLLDVSSSFFFS